MPAPSTPSSIREPAPPPASIAVVRRPSPRVAEGEVTHLARSPVDAEVAARQHQAYVDLLQRHGYRIVEAPRLDDHPDGVFVEDALVVIDGLALLTRPGAASRRGEVASMVAVVEHLGLPWRQVEAPGTLDGGDVLVTDRHVLVGRSGRTNDAGIAQLQAAFAHTGRQVVAVPVERCLHLKSAVTGLPDGRLVAVPGWAPNARLEALGYTVLDACEPSGGDVLVLGDVVALPADAPGTVAMLRHEGCSVETVDVSELQKIEAGMTCMSVLIRR